MLKGRHVCGLGDEIHRTALVFGTTGTVSQNLIQRVTFEGNENGDSPMVTVQSGSTLQIQDSVFRSTLVNAPSGAILAEAGSNILMQTTQFERNVVESGEGASAITCRDCTMTVQNCAFRLNYSPVGGYTEDRFILSLLLDFFSLV